MSNPDLTASSFLPKMFSDDFCLRRNFLVIETILTQILFWSQNSHQQHRHLRIWSLLQMILLALVAKYPVHV